MKQVKIESGCKPGMKTITYQFEDGTKSIIEVEDKWAEMLEVSIRKEENSNRKERYHTVISLDSCDYEGEWFQSNEPDPAEACELAYEQERVDTFLETLTETQRRRLNYRMLDADISLREIARLEGVASKQVIKTFEQIKVKYKKFFE